MAHGYWFELASVSNLGAEVKEKIDFFSTPRGMFTVFPD